MNFDNKLIPFYIVISIIIFLYLLLLFVLLIKLCLYKATIQNYKNGDYKIESLSNSDLQINGKIRFKENSSKPKVINNDMTIKHDKRSSPKEVKFTRVTVQDVQQNRNLESQITERKTQLPVHLNKSNSPIIIPVLDGQTILNDSNLSKPCSSLNPSTSFKSPILSSDSRYYHYCASRRAVYSCPSRSN